MKENPYVHINQLTSSPTGFWVLREKQERQPGKSDEV